MAISTVRVEQVVALDFLQRCNRANSIDSHHTAIGLYDSMELVALVVFSYPTPEYSSEYTIELRCFSALPDRNPLSALKALLDSYRELQKPADFFTRAEEVKSLALTSGSLGMTELDTAKIWEWVDINRTYYTYKITATDSEKYYYGVSHVKKADASFEDCLNDGYMGSGAQSTQNKFHNWKRKHRSTLKKAVVATFDRRALAFQHEKELIGSSWRDDPSCLNSTTGGKTSWNGFESQGIQIMKCAVHGETKHQGGVCRTCIVSSSISIRLCKTHGEVKHRGQQCLTCASRATRSRLKCSVHGMTSHTGKNCSKCLSEKRKREGTCKIHGSTIFLDGICQRCFVAKNFSEKLCQVHGKAKHQGDRCLLCVSSKTQRADVCSVHGKTAFVGDTCKKCNAAKFVTLGDCELHGEVKMKGGKCYRCEIAKQYSMRECLTHGETKHRGETCVRCTIEKTNATRKARHGY